MYLLKKKIKTFYGHYLNELAVKVCAFPVKRMFSLKICHTKIAV